MMITSLKSWRRKSMSFWKGTLLFVHFFCISTSSQQKWLPTFIFCTNFSNLNSLCHSPPPPTNHINFFKDHLPDHFVVDMLINFLLFGWHFHKFCQLMTMQLMMTFKISSSCSSSFLGHITRWVKNGINTTSFSVFISHAKFIGTLK